VIEKPASSLVRESENRHGLEETRPQAEETVMIRTRTVKDIVNARIEANAQHEGWIITLLLETKNSARILDAGGTMENVKKGLQRDGRETETRVNATNLLSTMNGIRLTTGLAIKIDGIPQMNEIIASRDPQLEIEGMLKMAKTNHVTRSAKETKRRSPPGWRLTSQAIHMEES
jgi:hypothetical protein